MSVRKYDTVAVDVISIHINETIVAHMGVYVRLIHKICVICVCEFRSTFTIAAIDICVSFALYRVVCMVWQQGERFAGVVFVRRGTRPQYATASG